MTETLISTLVQDLRPIRNRAMQTRLAGAVALGALITIPYAWLLLSLAIGRPFVPLWGEGMFWMKFGYALVLGLLGLSAVPALSRPDGHIRWPFVAAGLLTLVVFGLGMARWMTNNWAMPDLMGNSALVCPWLIGLTGLPMLAALLGAMRVLAPRSPAWAGLAAGLLAGGFGALAYALFCAENGMMFIAVWYGLGIGLTTALGALLGRWLLRW